MMKHRTALIVQALILIGLLIAAVVSAPTRAATQPRPDAYTSQLGQIQADYVRSVAGKH